MERSPSIQDDGAQAVEHIVHAARIGGDVGVQADQGVAQIGFDQRLLRLARQVGGADEMPAETGDRATLPGEAGPDGRGAVHPGETVPDEGFDGVGFVKCQFLTSVAVKALSRIRI
jgi:hypothetical protein